MLRVIIQVQVFQFLRLSHDEIHTLLTVIILHVQRVFSDFLSQDIIFGVDSRVVQNIVIFLVRSHFDKSDGINVHILAHQFINPKLHAVTHLPHFFPQRIQNELGFARSQAANELERGFQVRVLQNIVQVHSNFVHHFYRGIFVRFSEFLFGKEMLVGVHGQVEQRIVAILPERKNLTERILSQTHQADRFLDEVGQALEGGIGTNGFVVRNQVVPVCGERLVMKELSQSLYHPSGIEAIGRDDDEIGLGLFHIVLLKGLL